MIAGGIGVAVPLPRLQGMLNGNGTAYAAGAPLPKRFGTWFFGNGILPAHWIPTATGIGSAWTLSPALQPLLEVKPWLQVVTGLAIKLPNIAPHKAMPAAALTGWNSAQDVQAPSIDQLMVPLVNAGATLPYRTGIHVGISNTSGAGALDLRISFQGPGASNPPEYDPVNLFHTLLMYSTRSSGSAAPAGPDPELARRKRVLDAVKDSAASLRLRLGKDDQVRLDQHLTGVDQLETQIATLQTMKPVATSATLVDPTTAYPNMGAVGSITALRCKAMSDLIVFALATDLTRVFTYMFTCAACHGSYADAGLANATFHEDYGHRRLPAGEPGATDGFKKGVVYAMTNLNDTLVRMKNTPDGAGNLLDNSCVYVTSCTGESKSHGAADYPILVAGKAGGALKGDQHVRIMDDNVSKVPFTLLTMMGAKLASFGNAQGMVTAGIPDLLA
jgi:Protein of unknown function (DUF1552)